MIDPDAAAPLIPAITMVRSFMRTPLVHGIRGASALNSSPQRHQARLRFDFNLRMHSWMEFRSKGSRDCRKTYVLGACRGGAAASPSPLWGGRSLPRRQRTRLKPIESNGQVEAFQHLVARAFAAPAVERK